MIHPRLELKIYISKYTQIGIFCLLLLSHIPALCQRHFNPSENMGRCEGQVQKPLSLIPDGRVNLPRNIDMGKVRWRFTDYRDWYGDVWTGSLWHGVKLQFIMTTAAHVKVESTLVNGATLLDMSMMPRADRSSVKLKRL